MDHWRGNAKEQARGLSSQASLDPGRASVCRHWSNQSKSAGGSWRGMPGLQIPTEGGQQHTGSGDVNFKDGELLGLLHMGWGETRREKGDEPLLGLKHKV